jgi:hypothetical protein
LHIRSAKQAKTQLQRESDSAPTGRKTSSPSIANDEEASIPTHSMKSSATATASDPQETADEDNTEPLESSSDSQQPVHRAVSSDESDLKDFYTVHYFRYCYAKRHKAVTRCGHAVLLSPFAANSKLSRDGMAIGFSRSLWPKHVEAWIRNQETLEAAFLVFYGLSIIFLAAHMVLRTGGLWGYWMHRSCIAAAVASVCVGVADALLTALAVEGVKHEYAGKF